MKKYYKINGYLDGDVLNDFMICMNNLSENDELTLMITSSGGSCTVADRIINIINNDDRIEKVVFNWQNSSAAFDILIGIDKSKREIREDIYSTLHLFSRSVDTKDLITQGQETKFLLKELDDANKKLLKTFKKIGISKKNIKKIKKGKDVTLSYKQIMKLVI